MTDAVPDYQFRETDKSGSASDVW
eukprot:SAG31_NODE_32988_length_349_cov_0.904000_1_plen_23_part_10